MSEKLEQTLSVYRRGHGDVSSLIDWLEKRSVRAEARVAELESALRKAADALEYAAETGLGNEAPAREARAALDGATASASKTSGPVPSGDMPPSAPARGPEEAGLTTCPECDGSKLVDDSFYDHRGGSGFRTCDACCGTGKVTIPLQRPSEPMHGPRFVRLVDIKDSDLFVAHPEDETTSRDPMLMRHPRYERCSNEATTFGPKCPAGDACENKVCLEEYERVDREHTEWLKRQLSNVTSVLNSLWRCNDDIERQALSAPVSEAIKRYLKHPDSIDVPCSDKPLHGIDVHPSHMPNVVDLLEDEVSTLRKVADAARDVCKATDEYNVMSYDRSRGGYVPDSKMADLRAAISHHITRLRSALPPRSETATNTDNKENKS